MKNCGAIESQNFSLGLFRERNDGLKTHLPFAPDHYFVIKSDSPSGTYRKVPRTMARSRPWARRKLKHLMYSSFVSTFMICRRFWRPLRRIKAKGSSIHVICMLCTLHSFCTHSATYLLENFCAIRQVWMPQVSSLSKNKFQKKIVTDKSLSSYVFSPHSNDKMLKVDVQVSQTSEIGTKHQRFLRSPNWHQLHFDIVTFVKEIQNVRLHAICKAVFPSKVGVCVCGGGGDWPPKNP